MEEMQKEWIESVGKGVQFLVKLSVQMSVFL